MDKISIEIKWALIFALGALAWMALEKMVGLHSTHIDKHMYLTNLFAIPAIIIFILALKDKKTNFYNGQMSYKQGFISGLIISVIVAALSPLTQWITSTIISPEYFPNIIDFALDKGFFKTREEAAGYFNLNNYIIQATFGGLVMGIITSAIVAYFVKTKNVR